MNAFLVRWAINSLALYVAIAIVPGIKPESTRWFALLMLGLIFGLLNAVLRPILKLLTCPLIMFTLGLFILILNTFLFVLTGWLGSQFHIGFTVVNFWAAFLGALVTSVVSFTLTLLLKDELKKH
jgi:putative membrane protein